MNAFIREWDLYLIPLFYLAGSILAGLILSMVILHIVSLVLRRKDRTIARSFRRTVRSPLRVLFPLLILHMVFPSMELAEQFTGLARHVLSILSIIGFSWLLIRLTLFVEDIVRKRYQLDVRDNLEARKVQTQIHFFRQVVTVVVIIIAFSTILMTFDRVRQLGTAILASAGLVGVIAGFAAQRSLGTLFAGFQIAITQPIRLDDVVIVEGEWGRIEEITLTYVVVKIWDLRRLVLPITYFIEKPFQNWTRISADLLGTVYLYTDYTVPVSEVRQALHDILDESEYWDRKVWNLQVTNASDRTVELRALMSAQDAGLLWDLRCEVREKLIAFIQRSFPESLPKTRAEFSGRSERAERNDGKSPGPAILPGGNGEERGGA